MPSNKVRAFAAALVVAWVLHGCLRWVGFCEFAGRDAEGLVTLAQLVGDMVLPAFSILVIWGQFTEVEKCYPGVQLH